LNRLCDDPYDYPHHVVVDGGIDLLAVAEATLKAMKETCICSS
jgi:hypothetical protein